MKFEDGGFGVAEREGVVIHLSRNEEVFHPQT